MPLTTAEQSLNKAIKVACVGDKGKHEAIRADMKESFAALNKATNGKFYKWIANNF